MFVKDYKLLTVTAKKIILKETEFLNILSRRGGKVVSTADIRFALYKLEFSTNEIDRVLVRFVNGYKILITEFVNKVKAFIQHY